MADIKIKITRAQREVILAHVNGSESLDAAIALGLVWTLTTLTCPAAALAPFLAFVGMRSDIAKDNLYYESDLLPSERSEYTASINLCAKVEAATGRTA